VRQSFRTLDPERSAKAGVSAMHLGFMLAALWFALAAPALAQPGSTHGVANAALVAAAKATPLKLIDYDQDLCRNDRTVAAWLRELTGDEAREIVWTGGPCQLVDSRSGLDAGGAWCAQATIQLKHPRGRADRPMVEIFFDKPAGGRPGPAYAFRGDIADAGLLRFRRDFEAAWLERFPATAKVVACPDD
jgi:hypothetical protein